MKTLRKVLRMLGRNDKALLPHAFIYSLVSGMTPLVNIYLPKLMLDELLGRQDVRLLIFYTALLSGLNLLFALIRDYERYQLEVHITKAYTYLVARTNDKAMSLSYQDGETKATQDLMEQAEFSTYFLYEINMQLSGFGMVFTLLGGLSILAANDWRLLLLAILPSLLSLPCFRRVKELDVDNNRRSAPEHRAYIYFGRMAEDFRWAKDLKLYQGTSMMLRRAKAVMDRILRINHEYFTKHGFWMGLVRLLVEGQTAVIFLLLGLSLATGQVTAGAFTLLYGACRQSGEAMTALISLFARLKTADLQFEPLMELLELPQEESADSGHMPPDVREALDKARQGQVDIEAKDISFRYPTGDRDVLNNLSMRIAPGETLALVGRNGAGKSTLVSLLCRLYPPTSGVITLNGVDVQRIPLSAYRGVLAPIFQDYRLLPLKISESLLGKRQQDISSQDEDRLTRALEEVGMDGFVLSGNEGIHTYLQKVMDEKGLVPSGGQDQKLALARAVCRQGTFIILDEPTAALDPRSEEEIFSRMLSLTRGQTSLFISHRLSSTRFADRILVLDAGQAAQSGSHQELMAQEGLYQRMYATQAEAYRKEA